MQIGVECGVRARSLYGGRGGGAIAVVDDREKEGRASVPPALKIGAHTIEICFSGFGDKKMGTPGMTVYPSIGEKIQSCVCTHFPAQRTGGGGTGTRL